MREIVDINNSNAVKVVKTENFLIELTEGMLLDARATINSNRTLSVPIAELSTLGSGVSSLIPALNTVTQTTTVAAEGLYKLANAAVGDTLKVARNNNFWGALKTADGASKMAQFQTAGSLSATTTTVAAINPAIMLMSVALFSIERELGHIAEMEKQIFHSWKLKRNQKSKLM